MMMRNQQAGLTLIETILVLMIAALILGGIWLSYSQVRLNDEITRTVEVMDQTIQITRDYLASQSSVPNVSATNTLSYNLYNAGMMPPQLSYGGTTSTTTNVVGAGSAVFKSPMGADFYVQYPKGGPASAKYFQVVVGLQNASQCLKLMPKLIGTTRMMNDRGLLGYSYGGNGAWLSSAGTAPTGLTATALLPTWTTAADGATSIPVSTQNTYCTAAVATASASQVVLYFAMRP